MKYLQKMQQVEAEPVQLGGERLMVVAAGGRAHAVPADVFELFFAPETPKEEADRVLVLQLQADGFRPVKAAAKPAAKPAAKKSAPAARTAAPASTAPTTETDGELTTGEAIMRAVAEGPRTQTETIDRVLDILGWDRNDKKKRNAVHNNIGYRLGTGSLIKRDCPETHLPKLYLGGAK